MDRWHELGAFIREQRGSARLSLRRLSELAGISNPYLSQIERGLRRPSAEILQQIAKALRISAETLYVQAGILEPPDGSPDLTGAIMADRAISDDQKQALVRIYLSFRREFEDEQAQAQAAQAAQAQAAQAEAAAKARAGSEHAEDQAAASVRADRTPADTAGSERPGSPAAAPTGTAAAAAATAATAATSDTPAPAAQSAS